MDSSIVLLARIVDSEGRPIRPADVAAIECFVEEEHTCGSARTCVAADPSEIVLPTLSRDTSWTADNIGYNVRHAIAGAFGGVCRRVNGRVVVTYVLTLRSCQRVTVRFHLKANS